MSEQEITFRESFSFALPDIPVGTPCGGASVSSVTVGRESRPKLLTSQDVGYWLQLADNFLKSEEARKAKTLDHLLYEKGESAVLDNEQDVVTYSNLYLIHPLYQSMRAKFPTSSVSRSQEVPLGKLRIDMNWRRGNKPTSQVFLNLEFKRAGYLDPNEFRAAMVRKTDAKLRLQALQRTREKTLLDSNTKAIKIIKQASAYARITMGKCRYAALYDYKHLILLVFDDLQPNSNATTVGDTALCTIVEAKDHRKALLGFMIQAHDNCSRIMA